jgi:hypothetical protein
MNTIRLTIWYDINGWSYEIETDEVVLASSLPQIRPHCTLAPMRRALAREIGKPFPRAARSNANWVAHRHCPVGWTWRAGSP